MTKSLDRLTLLETFVRIAERGVISAAARDLGLSQASASRQLSDLEERLGVQLITRTTHSLSLTPAGENCLREARVLLADWTAFSERFADDDDALSGSLKIVAPIALGQTVALEAAIAFQASHPDVTIDWILEDRPIRFSEVGCDLWIRIGDVPDETLIAQPLSKAERRIYAAPAFITKHKVDTPRDLAALPCASLTPFEGAKIPLRSAAGKRFSLAADVAFASNNIFSTIEVACAGYAFAVLPDWLVEQHVASNQLQDVLPGWRAPSLTIYAAFAPARRQTRRLREFISTLKATLSICRR